MKNSARRRGSRKGKRARQENPKSSSQEQCPNNQSPHEQRPQEAFQSTHFPFEIKGDYLASQAIPLESDTEFPSMPVIPAHSNGQDLLPAQENTTQISRNTIHHEVLMSRLSHLSRRLEELHQVEIHRSSEERKETWILVFALSVVLIFCFAAFFMNQMEVRDLKVSLENDLERRTLQTVASIEETLEDFHLDKLTKLHSSLESVMRKKDQRDREALLELLVEVQKQGKRGEGREAHLNKNLKSLEDHLKAFMDLSKVVQEQQLRQDRQKQDRQEQELSANLQPTPSK